MGLTIRPATGMDVGDLADIYNYEVTHGTATLDLEPRSLDDRLAWLGAHNVDNHPLVVAVDDSGDVMGYASLSPYRDKDAYETTVEVSVYVHRDHRGKGVATALMGEVLDEARARDDVHCVVSVITEGNAASEALHRKFGFTYRGTMHEVAMKFGRWLSIDNWDLVVG